MTDTRRWRELVAAIALQFSKDLLQQIVGTLAA
jgi:hypothetical protein